MVLHIAFSLKIARIWNLKFEKSMCLLKTSNILGIDNICNRWYDYLLNFNFICLAIKKNIKLRVESRECVKETTSRSKSRKQPGPPMGLWHSENILHLEACFSLPLNKKNIYAPALVALSFICVCPYFVFV